MLEFLKAKKHSVKTKKEDGLLNDHQREQADRKLIKIGVIIAAAVSLLNYQSIEELKTTGRTVIAPFGTHSGDMWISGTDASLTYLRRVSNLFVSLYLSLNASNVSANFADLLQVSHPATYSGLRDRLLTKAETIKRYAAISYVARINTDKSIKVDVIKPADLSETKQQRYGQIKTPLYRLSIPVEVAPISGDMVQPAKVYVQGIIYTIDNSQFQLVDIEGLEGEGT